MLESKIVEYDLNYMDGTPIIGKHPLHTNISIATGNYSKKSYETCKIKYQLTPEFSFPFFIQIYKVYTYYFSKDGKMLFRQNLNDIPNLE